MNAQKLLFVSIVMLSSLITGCVNTPHKFYNGPTKPIEEVAVIKWTNIGNSDGVGLDVTKVNDKNISFPFTFAIYVEPGEHELFLECLGNNGRNAYVSAEGKLKINTVAGRIYKLLGRVDSTKEYMQIHKRDISQPKGYTGTYTYNRVKKGSCTAKVVTYIRKK